MIASGSGSPRDLENALRRFNEAKHDYGLAQGMGRLVERAATPRSARAR
jgi:hypothetical protein